MIQTELIRKLKEATWDAEQAAREIYYAMSYIPEGNPELANLQKVLELLGVKDPSEVKLSDSVLKKRI